MQLRNAKMNLNYSNSALLFRIHGIWNNLMHAQLIYFYQYDPRSNDVFCLALAPNNISFYLKSKT